VNGVRIDKWTKLVLGVAILGFIAFAPTFFPHKWQHVFIMWAFWSIIGMGWSVVLRVGEFSAGQAVFLCIGGYSASVLTLKLDFPFWLAIILPALFCSVVALAVGVVLLRLKGLYFLVISFVFAEIVRLTIAANGYLGASEGLWGMPVPKNIGFVNFSTKQGWVYLFAVILLVACFTFNRLEKSRTGTIYGCVGTAPDLTQSFGIYFMKYRVQAFVISGFFTGLAGATMAIYVSAISPDSFSFYYSLVAQLVAILGGIGSLVWGPLLGALLYAVFDEYLVYVPGARSLLMGILLVAVIFFLPQGLISLHKRFVKRKGASSIWHYLK
jgi:branched-chain amino acid transport system permease protein